MRVTFSRSIASILFSEQVMSCGVDLEDLITLRLNKVLTLAYRIKLGLTQRLN